MTRFKDSLESLAREGERAYASAPAPVMYPDDYVSGVRGIRRRRSIGSAALTVAAVLALGAVGLQVRGAAPVEPALPTVTVPPGEVVWTADVGAEMWSSPVVVGGAVVVGANDGVVRSVSLATGLVEWEFATGGEVRATVAVDGDNLYAASDDGFLYALTAHGDERWRVEIGAAGSRDVYDTYASRPVVVDDTVVVAASDGTVRALSTGTGEVRWEVELGGAISADLAQDSGLVFVANHDTFLYALDVSSGAQSWAHGMGSPVMSSPGAAEGVVVSGSRGTQVVARDALTGDELWRVSMGQSWAESSVQIVDGVAYFGSSASGEVVAADLATGAVQWRAVVGGWPWARPTYADGAVYATSGRNEGQQPWNSAVYQLDAATGTVEWRAPTGPAAQWRPEGAAYGAMTSPAVVGDLVIVAGLDGVLYALAR